MHDQPEENRSMNGDEDGTGGTPWVSSGSGDTHGVPPAGRARPAPVDRDDRAGRPGDDQPAGRPGGPVPLVSAQDVEDADDILFAHPPRVVTRWLCGCGEDYPCPDVRFARLVRAVHATDTGVDDSR